jgi:hypothetical protein
MGGPSSLAKSGGAIPSMGCVVPQPFSGRGNQSYPDSWVVTVDTRYPGYKTPTKVTMYPSMGAGNAGSYGTWEAASSTAILNPWFMRL